MSTPLFENLEIKQFRAFESLTIEKLGHVNLIVGKNGVGKSTLLEALYIYANAHDPYYMRKILSNRGDYRPEDPSYIGIAFFNLFYGYPEVKAFGRQIYIGRIGDAENAMFFSAFFSEPKHKTSSDSVGSTGICLRVKCGDIQYAIPVIQQTDTRAYQYGFVPEGKNQAQTMVCLNVFVKSSGEPDLTFKYMWEQIALTDAKDDVIEAIRIVEPAIKDFMFATPEKGSPYCKVRLEGRAEPVAAKTLGEGLNRVMGLSLALTRCHDGILLIDEIENGLHWSVMPDLWRFIGRMAARLNVQVFATTHSHDCLRSFYLGTKDVAEIDPVVVRIEKDGSGHHAEIFDKERLGIVVRERIEIR